MATGGVIGMKEITFTVQALGKTWTLPATERDDGTLSIELPNEVLEANIEMRISGPHYRT